MHLEEHLLNDVLEIGRASEHAIDKRRYERRMAPEQLGECRLVSALRSLDEPFNVFSHLRLHVNRWRADWSRDPGTWYEA